MTNTALRDRVASTAVAVQSDSQQPTIYDLVNRQRPQVALALPKGMDPDRFTRLVITQVRQTPELAQCTPASLLGSLMLSAQLGLEPGPLGHVWLIPRWNKKSGHKEVSFQIGYKGIIELARRSGQLSSIEAHEVCENDEFDFTYGLEPTLVHKPCIRGERGPAYAYYAVAKFKDGGNAFVVLSRDDIEKRRARSSSTGGPWTTDYDAMARKSCIRALAAFLPLSSDLERAFRSDEQVYTHIEPDMADTPQQFVDIPADDVTETAEDDEPTGEVLPPAEQHAQAEAAREQLPPKKSRTKKQESTFDRVEGYAARLGIEGPMLDAVTAGQPLASLDDDMLVKVEQALRDVEMDRAYLQRQDDGTYRYIVGRQQPDSSTSLL